MVGAFQRRWWIPALIALAALAVGCSPRIEGDCPPGSTWHDPLCVPHRLIDPCDPDDDGRRAVSCGGNDCDDGDPTIHPGAVEVCNGRDDDCDGATDEPLVRVWYPDGDGDGFGRPGPTASGCDTPGGHVPTPGDCDDSDRNVHPGVVEVCDGRDDDCDGATDEGVSHRYYADADRDGRGDPFDFVDACSAPAGRVVEGTDCDDSDEDAHVGQTESFAEPRNAGGFDYDCDGTESPIFSDVLVHCLDCLAAVDGWLDVVPGCGVAGTRLFCDWFPGTGCRERQRLTEVMRCR